jgi:hypothetical protein
VDKVSLVEIGRTLLRSLKAEGLGVHAALWVRDLDDQWRLWIAPDRFTDSRSFYLALASVLAKHRSQTGNFEISSVKVVEPTNSILVELRRFGRVSPDFPMMLQSEQLGGYFLNEGILMEVA